MAFAGLACGFAAAYLANYLFANIVFVAAACTCIGFGALSGEVLIRATGGPDLLCLPKAWPLTSAHRRTDVRSYGPIEAPGFGASDAQGWSESGSVPPAVGSQGTPVSIGPMMPPS